MRRIRVCNGMAVVMVCREKGTSVTLWLTAEYEGLKPATIEFNRRAPFLRGLECRMRICERNLPLLAEYVRSGRVVAFDTETTGCASHDEICQIAAVEYVCGELSRKLALYICPTCEMNPWAEAVHGLSLDFLYEHGIAPEAAMRQFFEFLGNDVLLVAHNNKFDIRMLNQECVKFGLCFSPEGIETCDTLALSRYLRPDLERHTLAHLIEALGINGVNSHDALDDALACAGVLFTLINR